MAPWYHSNQFDAAWVSQVCMALTHIRALLFIKILRNSVSVFASLLHGPFKMRLLGRRRQVEGIRSQGPQSI